MTEEKRNPKHSKGLSECQIRLALDINGEGSTKSGSWEGALSAAVKRRCSVNVVWWCVSLRIHSHTLTKIFSAAEKHVVRRWVLAEKNERDKEVFIFKLCCSGRCAPVAHELHIWQAQKFLSRKRDWIMRWGVRAGWPSRYTEKWAITV